MQWDDCTFDANQFGREIYVLGHYLSKLQVLNPNWESLKESSNQIRALKQYDATAIELFTAELNQLVPSHCVVTVVPPHTHRCSNSGILQVARRISLQRDRTDATHCLRRFMTIPKLSYGGIRNEGLHFESIVVQNQELLADCFVVLLDDVMTTGSSLRACKTLLLQAGARAVQPIALGRTVRGEI